MIGKVIRGSNVERLLYYLYGPGKANEHIDPHLVAGFSDPAELEPERRSDGSADVRRLAGLLNQPLAALLRPGYAKPVWHCAVRAAPGDRELSDDEWAQVAAGIMDRTGLAPSGDELGVRWVAVRHAADHIHLVATLARQDGIRPKIWNDFYRVREACQEAERQFGLTTTAPADRTAARRPARAETEQTRRRGWGEVPRTRLRREVCTAAAGARTEQEFFRRLTDAGVLIRFRYSTIRPDQVTGYAVGLPEHAARDGGTIWYSGGKLAADLTLPKLRTRWTSPAGESTGEAIGRGLSPAAARGALRTMVATAAERSSDEVAFFAALRHDGVLVRLRFSQLNPGEVTGYSVALTGHCGADGEPIWYGGGRLAASLSLPRLRHRWRDPQRSGPAEHHGAAGLTVPERNEIFDHAARQAVAAAEQIRWCSVHDPRRGADAAHAAADVLHVAARITGSRTLHRAADAYDRAARMPYGRVPRRDRCGGQLRAAARLLALASPHQFVPGTSAIALVVKLADLVLAVAELRQAQQHAAQTCASRSAAGFLQSYSPATQRPGTGLSPTAAYGSG